jgi:hypothetical protein
MRTVSVATDNASVFCWRAASNVDVVIDHLSHDLSLRLTSAKLPKANLQDFTPLTPLFQGGRKNVVVGNNK